uniref:Uncharacterized protein n=1 Tax=Schistocephalus solidus TaxID=70667 RepID=A0A0X3P5N2_SCHSO
MERSVNPPLDGRPLARSGQSLSCCSLPVFVTTFIIMGLSVSVLGPSVIFFEEISNTWEDEIALLFTARAVGALGGWLLSIACLEGRPKYCGCLMGVGLSGLTIINFSVAFVRRLWWLMGAFAVQGCFLVVSAQGCLTYVISRGGRRKRQIHQILVFCSLLGYALAPIMMIPLTCGPNIFLVDKPSLLMTKASSVANHPINRSLHRARRLAELQLDPITFQPSLLNNSGDDTSTNLHNLTDVNVPVLVTAPLPRVPTSAISSSASNESKKTTLEMFTKTPPHSPTSRSPMSGSSLTSTSITSIRPLVMGSQEQQKNPEPTSENSQGPLQSSIKVSIVPSFSPTPIASKSRPPLTNVASATKLQATELTAESNQSSLQPLAKPDTFPSFLVNTTSSPGMSLPNTTTTQTAVPKKPSIVDAMHLSQDSRTADGSKTVAKMKEVDEDVRLTVVDSGEQSAIPAKPPVSLETSESAKVKLQPATTTTTSTVSPPAVQPSQFPPMVNVTSPSHLQPKGASGNKSAKRRPSQAEVDPQNSRKPLVVDAVHLKQDHNSADGSDTAVKMKEGVRLIEVEDENPEMKIKKRPPVSTSEGSGQNKPVVSPSNPRIPESTRLPLHSDQPKGNLSENKSSTTNETRISPPAVVPLRETKNNKSEGRENGAKKRPVSQAEGKISEPPSVEGELSNEQRSNDSYSLHSSYTTLWNRFAPRPWNHHFTREQYIRAIHRVYLALCLLTVMAWFIVLPLTGFYQHLRSVCDRCFSACPQPFRTGKHGSVDLNVDLEADAKTNLLSDPKRSELPAVPTGRVSPKCFRFEETNGADSSDVGIDLTDGVTDGNVGRRCVGFRQVFSSPNFAVLRSPSSTQRDTTNGLTPAISTYLWYNPEPTIWPKISWPRDFWLILSAFFFAGLETTFGAFVHTFTLRTLHWSQCDALWVTAVFWCGNVLGRLSCLCLGPSSDMGVTLLQGAIDLTSLHKSQGTAHPRRQRTTKIAILVTRSAGALMCVISAGMLKHFTKAYYVYQHKPANLLLELWSYSKDRATWIGSFGIGLGLGITASSGLSVCNRLGKRLHLAGLLGQMFLPAVSGYITERMFYKNASQTLGRTSLILSVFLFFSLAVDLVLRLIRHFSWWKKFTDYFRFVPVKQPAAKVTTSLKKKVSVEAIDHCSPNLGDFETPIRQQSMGPEPAGIPLREVNLCSSSSSTH